MRYSIFSLARNAASRHENWPLAWRSPEPKRSYDAIVVGGGGHGLATAYYLAKEHGISNVACWKRVGSAAAIPAATRLSCARTIISMRMSISTNSR